MFRLLYNYLFLCINCLSFRRFIPTNTGGFT